uniref:Uncharacterized protein n=1 Tax=Fagus sylvatica TaxID=28930 RepID=A0A2N9IW03_FAGSY
MVVDGFSVSAWGLRANLGLGWWVCAADLGLDLRAQELHDSPAPMETQNHLHRDPLRLGLCRGSPTRGLVHGAMGGGHMWRRRRDLGLFIEI